MTSIMKSEQSWANVICEARDEDNRIHVLQSGTVLFCCLKVSDALLLDVRLSVGSLALRTRSSIPYTRK